VDEDTILLPTEIREDATTEEDTAEVAEYMVDPISDWLESDDD
jgi:hypothetical protein